MHPALRCALVFMSCAVVSLVTAPAFAEPAGAPAVVTPPTAAAASAPATSTPAQPAMATPAASATPEATPEAATAPPASTCLPTCRNGFVCVAGQCVSACNPPCAGNERCTERLECVAKTSFTAAFFTNAPTKLPPPEAGVHEHDGFMVRATLGGGVAGASQSNADSGGSTLDFAGISGAFALDVGTTPYDNLVVHLRVSDTALRNPTVKLDGQEVAGSRHDWIGAGLVGVGAGYYFMPANVYAAGTIGVSWMRVHGPNDDRAHTTDTGAGLNLDIGKEWWIDTQWGIGVAARFWISRLSDSDRGERVEYKFASGALLFSATYQ